MLRSLLLSTLVFSSAHAGDLTIRSGNGTAALDWPDSAQRDATYVVYRKTEASEFIQIASTDSSEYLDVGLTNGENYTYRVALVDSSGKELHASEEALATPTVPTSTPEKESFHQVDPLEVTGYPELKDTSGTWFDGAARVGHREISAELEFGPAFIVPPAARHSTAISMTAREAAFDPRSVQYYFEATSEGGNDSGWQRDRLYIDSGMRAGDRMLEAGKTYTYRLRTRKVDPDTGVPIVSSESPWSKGVSATTPAQAARPNIIVFMVDDLGWEAFDIYGSSSHNTPRLTEMANEGIRMTNFHSQPLCTPSRVAIMSGRSNHRNYTGFDNYHQNTSFGNFFQNAGYKTAIAGKWQLDGGKLNGIDRRDPRVPHWLGFDEYLLWHFAMANGGGGVGSRYWNPQLSMSLNTSQPQLSNYLDVAAMAKSNATIPAGTPLITISQWNGSDPYDPAKNRGKKGTPIDKTDFGPDLINDFINDFANKSAAAGDPFFIYCPMILPHNPWPNPPTIDDSDPKGTQSKTGNSKHALTEYMDHLVGRTLDMLREHPDPNVAKNTLVIFTADNGTNVDITSTFRGAPFRGAKRETRDAGHHVPFIAWWGGDGGRIPVGQVCHDMTTITDIMATICDATGVPIWRPASTTGGEYVEYIHDSRSLFTSFFGKNEDPRRYLFQMWLFKKKTGTAAWVHNGRYKLYRDGPEDRADKGADQMDRSGKFFDLLNTPLERVPNETNSIDDSLTGIPAGSELEALRSEFQKVLDLMDSDVAADRW